MITEEAQTVAQRLAEGTLRVQDALNLSASVAEALRKVHDDRNVHGALTPSTIGLTQAGVAVFPAPTMLQGVTPYTAPEVLRGRPADARSDIYSFGAIVYELFTGRPPFAAASPEALGDAVLNTAVPPIGSPVDALLANCLAKDPSARWQRMHRVNIELKLLRLAAQLKENPAPRESVGALVHAEVQHIMSAQVGTCLETQNRAIENFQQAASASLQAMEAQFHTIESKLVVAQESASRAEDALPKLALRISTLEEQESGAERVAEIEVQLQKTAERIARSEEITESMRTHAADFAENVTSDLNVLEQSIRPGRGAGFHA